MAITKRNYIRNTYEAFSNESIGTPVLDTWTRFSLDGLFAFDVADVKLYQGGVEVPTSAYELKKDSKYTEAEADYTGLTIYKMFRITNASYAGIETTASGKNYGSAVDNELLYSLYQTVLNTPKTGHTGDASLTTSTILLNNLHVFSGLSADATFTITDGGGDERNKFTVRNADSTYKIIVTDGTSSYWVTPGQSVDFYENSGLVWASAGWERIYIDYTNTAAVDEADLLRALSDGAYLRLVATDYLSQGIMSIMDTTQDVRSSGLAGVAGSRYRWDASASQIVADNITTYPGEILLWHEAA